MERQARNDWWSIEDIVALLDQRGDLVLSDGHQLSHVCGCPKNGKVACKYPAIFGWSERWPLGYPRPLWNRQSLNASHRQTWSITQIAGCSTSDEYVQVLQQLQMIPSMSRPANPYDNASCESFMKTLKREEIYANEYRDRSPTR